MNEGWLKLHRKLKKKGYYRKSEYIHLWIHLLISANHEPKEFMFNNTIQTLQPGQLLTGRNQLAKDTGINRNSVERILKCFQNEQQIEQQTTTKFRVITIKNWKDYQQTEQVNEQQVSNKAAASEQQVSTNKNEKNIKNERTNKENIKEKKVSNTDDPAYKAFTALCAVRNLEVDVPSTRYLEMREEYTKKIGAAWWQQVQACVNWCYDHEKKKITTSRLRNWMVRSIQFAKEKEIKQLQNFQDKSTAPEKIKKAINTPLWTPPS